MQPALRTLARRPRWPTGSRAAWFLSAVLLVAEPLGGQEPATLIGRVTEVETGSPVESATVLVAGTRLGTLTARDGRFRIPGIPPGDRRIEVSALGYAAETREVTVPAGGETRLEIALTRSPVTTTGIRVSVLRPDLSPQATMGGEEVREANPKDSGELLRALPGVDAVRRGAIGLDPVVRGLRETEVGTYLDGTRIFPAGPARMDSPLTHFDPSAVQDITVVKGPYALTWGAGNLSAIRVETQDVPPPVPGLLHGRLFTGYDTNLNAAETGGTLSGRSGPVSWWGHGVWRGGDDYESGRGEEIPGDFRSWEGRGKLSVETGPESRVTLAGGYQEQGPIDYPGRLLTAEFFEALNLSARWELTSPSRVLRSLDVMAYVNNVDHGMSNREKPTAEPNPDRTPPFALDVRVESAIDVTGGRAAVELVPSEGWSLELGSDVYSANRNAVRAISRRDDGMLLFEDLMWPDARITDAGAFARLSRTFSDRVNLAATGRLDVVRAEADTASEFFRENTTGELEADEANLSGAVTLGLGLSPNWTLSLGVGSAVRTADASERYSDRIPATKAQTAAEFMGNPDLEPERSTQADVWLEGSYSDLVVSLNAFARKVDDYITLEPTDLPKRLPLSPETVFRYINGEATFWGFESVLGYAFTPTLRAEAASAFTWGREDTFDAPAFGVPPFRTDVSLRWDDPGDRFFAEGTFHGVADQGRVPEEGEDPPAAVARGELATDGYVTLDLKGGVRWGDGWELRLGLQNLTDAHYVNHLNSKNPFTGEQIPEPGIVFFGDLSFAF